MTSSGSAASASASASAMPRPRSGERLQRRKKPTYAARKEEKQRLETAVHALEAELRALKRRRAALEPPVALAPADAVREATRQQEMSLVSVHSALSGFMAGQTHLPFEMWIYLGTDERERRETLAALKTRKLRAGASFLRERARFLSPTRAFAEHARFDTPAGDLCALRFDVTPFEGVSDARVVFDALGHYFGNMEIWLTEALGDVTVREDDDSAGPGVTQIRLLSALPSGVRLEMNKVMYADFSDAERAGMYTADYVDRDELHPYQPSDRLRLDVTGALTVREVKRTADAPPTASGGDGDGDGDGGGERRREETVVVMTRVCQLHLRASSAALPPGTLHDLRECVGVWEDVMMRTVRQLVYT